MASEVGICNLALSNIRAGSINSFDEASSQAQLCRLKYPVLRDQALEDAPWQFSHRLIALALLTDEVHGWTYVYQYPNDCLRINKLIGDVVLPTDTKIPYEIFNIGDNKVIVSNEANLRIDYRAKVADPNLFTNQFVIALSHLLGGELAIPIAGVDKGRSLRQDEFKLYNAYLSAATAGNSNEQYSSMQESEFITVR